MPSIKKNFIYSTILTTANYIFPLLTYPYISRVLGVTNIGICNWVDSIINYFIMFSMMGMIVVGNREIAGAKNDKDNLQKTFSSLFLLNFVTTFIACVVLIIVTIYIPRLYEHKELMWIGLCKLISNFLLIDWFYKGIEDFKYITIRSLIIKCLYVVSIFIFIKCQSDYVKYYLIVTMLCVGNALISIVHVWKITTISFRNINIKKYLGPFLNYGYYTILTSAYTSFNIAYLGFVSGDTEVGYYSTATKLFSIIMAVFTSLTGVILPRASALAAEGRYQEINIILKKTLNILFSLSIPIIIFIEFSSFPIVYILSGPGYEGAVLPMKITTPLILIIGYEEILIIQGLMALKKDKAVTIGTTLGAILGLTLNILLVPMFHSIGASIVWLSSEIVVLINALYFMKKYMDFNFPIKKLLLRIIIYTPLILILFYLNKLKYDMLYAFAINSFACCLYFIIIQFGIEKDSYLTKLIFNMLNTFKSKIKY